MAACHVCHNLADESSLAAGKCGVCGAVLRKMPRRSIDDQTQPLDPTKTPPSPEPPAPPSSPGEQTITLGEEQATVISPMDLSAGSPPATDTGEDLGPEHDTNSGQENLETHRTETPAEPTDSDPYKTVAPEEKLPTEEAPTSDQGSSDEGQGTVAFSPDQTVDFAAGITGLDSDSDDPPSDEGQGTVAFSPDKTIDFKGDVSGDDLDSLVTANWDTNVEGDVKDSRGTIKQKDTVHGQMATKSSIVVKSRQFHSGRSAVDQIISPADAPDYELLDVIGEGGMGVVYAARQSAIARTVAVKMLKGKDTESVEQREKFISEAVVTGELDHPNIVPIYDLGSNDSGALFYSMKRVKGTPWNKVLSEKSLDENLNILLRVADAVAFAHANGVVHRDLKPENTMLGDFGEVLVMDWGLARISPDFPNADSVSQSDVMGGTPAYMAPEMATGPIEKVTIASDIYLLGAMLYEIIEGRTPHTGSTVMACLFAAAKNKIPPPKNPGELSDIALKAMATDPADRYASAREFQEALRVYQSHSESIVLTDSAAKSLAEARDKDDYDLFSRAMYGFQEAVTMWSGNRRAKELLSESKVAYANSALGRGDFELGLSLLDSQDAEHAEVIAQLEAGRKERRSRQRRMNLLKGLVAALIAAVIGTVGYAYVAVSQQRDIAVKARDEAVTQRDRAEEQEKIAKEQTKRAVAAEKDALEQKDVALAAEEEAVKQKVKADVARDKAIEQEKIAKEQRQLAVEAKQREEYEAYVAQIGLANAKIEENAFDRAQQLLMQCNEELSRWEWGRLAYLCQLSEATWQLDGPVEDIAYSPDGKYYATADLAGNAILWDAANHKKLKTLSHGQYVHAVAFDNTGTKFASGSSDRTIRIYSVPDGKQLRQLAGHKDGVISLSFSPDGRQLLSGSFDNTAVLWDVRSGKPVQQLKGHSWWVWNAEFSKDNNRIVTAGQDGKAIVWSRQASQGAYRPLTEFTKHRGPINAATFSPDGSRIATAGADGRILIWNPDEVQPVDIARRIDNEVDPPAPYVEFLGHEKPVCSIAFSPDGSQLISGGEDNVSRIWQVATGEQLLSLRGHTSYVRDCVFSPDGSRVLSASRDQQVKLWDPSSYGEALALGRNEGSQHADAVLSARFSTDGSQIVTASRDRTAQLWDTQSQTLVESFNEGHEFLASYAVFFSGGSKLATSAGDGTTRIWNVASGTEIDSLKGTGRTASLDVSADGRWLATAGNENNVKVWDLNSNKLVANLRGHEEAVSAISFASDGTALASGDERGRCRTWILEDNQWRDGQELRGHSRAITGLAFTPQGRLVSASGDNTCAQWDLKTGRELTTLVLKHPGWVTDLDVSEDGAMALTICDDGQLRLWSLEDARPLRKIQPRTNVLFTSVDISPNGKLAIAACAAEASVQMWKLDTGEEVTDGNAAWLDLGDRSGILWSAQFSPSGDRVLTIGGNDAQMWDIGSREQLVRFTPHGTVASADLSPDGRLLVTGSWDRSAKIWDVSTGKAIRKLDGVHQGFVNSVEFSPNGKLILTASDDGTARVWDVASGEVTEPIFQGHSGRVLSARFSADGSKVLTTSGDKTAKIWDASTGKILTTLSGHRWGVLCGEFSADANRVVTGSADDQAIVWDARSGEILMKLAGHTSSVTGVAFSPDGNRVLTGSRDSLCKLWDARTGKEILTLEGQNAEITSVSFSPDGLSVLTSDRDGQTRLWPALDWRQRRPQQAWHTPR